MRGEGGDVKRGDQFLEEDERGTRKTEEGGVGEGRWKEETCSGSDQDSPLNNLNKNLVACVYRINSGTHLLM